MTPTRAMIFKHLRCAAQCGAPCPTNAELAAVTGSQSVATPARVLSDLERMGLIQVDRYAAARRVTIVATGEATRDCAGRTHWSARGIKKAPPRFRVATGQHIAEPALDTSKALRVDRDPCPRCATRKDIGCACVPIPFAVLLDLFRAPQRKPA